MRKKSRKYIPKNIPKIIPCNAFRCNICGRVVPSIHRSRHLIVTHKLDGTSIKTYFRDLGTVFKKNKNAFGDMLMREYNRNQLRPKPTFICGSNPVDPKPFKIIYTPMGNKR